MNQFGKVLVPGHNSRHSGWEVGASRTSDIRRPDIPNSPPNG